MSTDKQTSKDIPALSLETIRDWLIKTTRTFIEFAIVLSLLCLALFVIDFLHLPLYASLSIVFIISAALFILLIKIAIENIVYQHFKKSIWGQVVVYLLGVVISAQSYLWAANEINRIFLVNPNALALTLTSLTAIQFLKYTIIALLSSYFIGIGLYFYYKCVSDKAIKNNPSGNAKSLTKKMILGVIFVITVALCLLSMDKVTRYSDVIIQAFALKVDFSSYANCKGSEFDNIEGVLFLSASDVLVAKRTAPMQWQFKQVKCEP